MPTTIRLMVRGLPAASSLTMNVPMRVPPNEGVAVKFTVHEVRGAKVAPQGVAVGVAETAKSPVVWKGVAANVKVVAG